MNKQIMLENVIKKFFEKKKAGTRQELIDFINEFCAEKEVVDKKNNVVKEAHRTTAYDYLNNAFYYKANIKDGWSAGKPKTFFFRAIDENKVKEILLKKEGRVELALRIIEYAKNNEGLFTREQVIKELKITKNKYYSTLKLLLKTKVIEPLGSKNSGVFLVQETDEKALKEMFWNALTVKK